MRTREDEKHFSSKRTSSSRSVDDAVTDIISGKVARELEKSKLQPENADDDEDIEGQPDRLSRHISTVSEGTIPPNPPSLRRNDRRLEPQPGAMAIPGNRARVHSTDETITTSTHGGSNDVVNSEPPSILVNAHLVEEPERDLEQQAQVQVVVNNHPTTTLVKAEPMDEDTTAGSTADDGNDNSRQLGIMDLMKNRTFQICVLFFCLIIFGLIVGVVAGFGSNGTGNVIFDSSD